MKRLAAIYILLAALSAIAEGQAAPAEAGKPAAAPVSVGIVVDNSGSFRAILDRVMNAALLVIDDLRPDDEGFLVTFVDSAKINLRQEMTHEKRDLRDAAENMFVEGGPTAILDAVVFATKYLAKNASAGEGRSKVLILITDGDDRENAATLNEVVKAAKGAGVRVFVLGLYDEKFYSKVVDRLTRETGGTKFVPKSPKDTQEAVENLLAAMRNK